MPHMVSSIVGTPANRVHEESEPGAEYRGFSCTNRDTRVGTTASGAAPAGPGVASPLVDGPPLPASTGGGAGTAGPTRMGPKGNAAHSRLYSSALASSETPMGTTTAAIMYSPRAVLRMVRPYQKPDDSSRFKQGSGDASRNSLNCRASATMGRDTLGQPSGEDRATEPSLKVPWRNPTVTLPPWTPTLKLHLFR